MSVASRIVLLILCALVVVVALATTRSQSHALDLKTAINIARTARFGPGNDARIDVWLKGKHPTVELQWTGGERGAFEREIPVILETRRPLESIRYQFKVTIEPRALLPVDDAAHRLVDSVRHWASSR